MPGELLSLRVLGTPTTRARSGPSLLLWTVAPLAALLLSAAVSAQSTGVPATSVRLLLPSSVVYDAAGNLYLAESSNHLVRKVDLLGMITTVAGTGVQVFSGDGGPAASASLDSPGGLALNARGDLFIADTHNHRVRRVDAKTQQISTVAGTGAAGFSGDGGEATAALMKLPSALACDAAGNLYIADTGNHRVRRLAASTGILTTVAGTGVQGFSGDGGLGTAAAIDSPTSLAVDAAGNLYLADTHNQRIRKLKAPDGRISTVAGNGSFGRSADRVAASSAALALPRGLSLDAAGNLYLADSANHRVLRIDAVTGVLTTVAGAGVQAYLGDGGSPTASAFDGPHATVISPAGLVTIADTTNGRVRQIFGATASSAGVLRTIAGLGDTTPGDLLISAPAVVGYGNLGAVTASLVSPVAATGRIVFLETQAGATSTLGSAGMISNSAVLDTSGMAVGVHNITASFPGDATHAAAQSTTLVLTVTPRDAVATPGPASMIYGQPVPALTGTVDGVLPRDMANVSVTFAVSAAALPPVGTYPIMAVISGSAAANYSLKTAPGSFTVTQAASKITLSTSGTDPLAPVLFSQAVSTTAGSPTGTITLLSGSTVLSVSPIAAAGSAVRLATGTLAAGTYLFTAVYSGDANFTPSTSPVLSVTVGPVTPATTVDFSVAATGASSQTISSGGAASFSFAVGMSGGSLSSPISLAATGLPPLAASTFDPGYLPPGAGPSAFILTIATPKAAANRGSSEFPLRVLLVLTAPVLAVFRRRRVWAGMGSVVSVAMLSLAGFTALAGCGDRIHTADTPSTAKTYNIVVSGTATTPSGGTIKHSANVTLTVN